MQYLPYIKAWENAILGINDFKLPQNKSAQERSAIAKQIAKYALLDFMGYTPEEAVAHMTSELAQRLMLDKVFRGNIHFPIDCSRDDWDYKAAFVLDYPVDYKRQTLRYYQHILDGTITKFPKGFFAGTSGALKAKLLLYKFIAERLPAQLTSYNDDETLKTLYARFADRAAINTELKRAEIFDACSRLYTTPLEYLHKSLRMSGEYDPGILDTLYAYHEFGTIYTDMCKIAEQQASAKRKAEKLAAAAAKPKKKKQ